MRKPINQSHTEMEKLLEDTKDDFRKYHLAYINSYDSVKTILDEYKHAIKLEKQ